MAARAKNAKSLKFYRAKVSDLKLIHLVRLKLVKILNLFITFKLYSYSKKSALTFKFFHLLSL